MLTMVVRVRIYLDLVYLFNGYVGLLCVLSIAVLNGKTFSCKKIFFVSLIWGFVVIGLYVKENWLIETVLSMFVSWLIDKEHWFKTFFLWIFLQTTYATSFLYFGDVICKTGMILVVGMSFSWLYAAFFGTIVITLYLFMLFSFKKQVIRSGLYYKVLIKKGTMCQIYQGFMDTGNQAVLDGYPVIFTDSIEVVEEKKVNINHAANQCSYPVMKVDLYWQGAWQEVFLAKVEHLDLEDAELLLNLELF